MTNRPSQKKPCNVCARVRKYARRVFKIPARTRK